MNLWFRMLFYTLMAWRLPRLTLPDDTSRLSFRVWPTDLDTSLHMNNGRYLTLMDLGRLDIMVSSGLWRAVMRNGWTPIASAIKIRFRRELKTFQKFRLETRIVAWDRTNVIMEQTFVIDGGDRDGQIAAQGLFKGGLYDRKQKKFIEISHLMAEIGVAAESPPLTPEVEAFLAADDEMKRAAQRAA